MALGHYQARSRGHLHPVRVQMVTDVQTYQRDLRPQSNSQDYRRESPGFCTSPESLSSRPILLQWIARTSAYLDQLQKDGAAPFEKISGEAAGQTICSSPAQPQLLSFEEPEGSRAGVKLGQTVSVVPSDIGMPTLSLRSRVANNKQRFSGKVPTVGKLLGLNHEEVVVETHGKAGTVQCHFPRLGFSVQVAKSAAKL